MGWGEIERQKRDWLYFILVRTWNHGQGGGLEEAEDKWNSVGLSIQFESELNIERAGTRSATCTCQHVLKRPVAFPSATNVIFKF